jgi:hypothetical protein
VVSGIIWVSRAVAQQLLAGTLSRVIIKHPELEQRGCFKMCLTTLCSKCGKVMRIDDCMDKNWCPYVTVKHKSSFHCDECINKKAEDDKKERERKNNNNEKSNATWYVKL